MTTTRAVRSASAVWLRMEPWQAEALARVLESWIDDPRVDALWRLHRAGDIDAAMSLHRALAPGREGEPLLAQQEESTDGRKP
jgi:hypothetical protein